jgi:hypothetical protein
MILTKAIMDSDVPGSYRAISVYWSVAEAMTRGSCLMETGCDPTSV